MQNLTKQSPRMYHFDHPKTGKFRVVETDTTKSIHHPDIQIGFRKTDGYTVTEGNNVDSYSPIGAFIADIEITTICHGVPQKDGTKKLCEMCYKQGSPNGTYMSIDTYRKVLDNINKYKTITQVALGADAEAKTNPDLEAILAYTRASGVVPNITVASLDDETADLIADYCGGVAVSVYDDFDVAFDTIKKLTDRGMNQVNIHRCIHEDNFESTMKLLDSIGNDSRLEKLHAVVFLSLKQKGRGIGFQRLSDEKFRELYRRCVEEKISFGMDSCGSKKFLDAASEYGNYDQIVDYVESCESSRMSAYVNVGGKFSPCSFIEGISGWETGIDVTGDIDFLSDVWHHPDTVEFRNKLLATKDCNGCCSCPVYNV